MTRFDLRKKGSPERTVAWCVGAGILFMIVTQFILPGTSKGRGTPTAILFAGLVTGALTALSTIGIVLIYRTSRVVNFAQAALGTLGAIFAYNFIVVFRVPYGLAFIAAILISAAFAFVAEMLLRRFFNAPRLVVTILTIGIGSLIATIGLGTIAGLPLWGQQRDLVQALGGTPVIPFRSFHFTLGDVHLVFRFAHIFALVVLVLAALGVGAFLRYTRLGIAVRASSENAERAELLGVNVRILSTVVWIIAGALSGAGLTLLGTTQSFSLGGQGAPGVLIAALAAAVLARMRSLPVAIYAAILVSIGQAAIGWSYRDQGGIFQGILFVVIVAGLLAQRRTLQRAEEGSSWEASQEIRSTPRELLDISSVRSWRRSLLGLGVIALVVFPWTVQSGMTNRASFAAITAIVLLSLVVLTGWAGQVSLGQYAFVAIGALVGGSLTSRAGIPFWFALPIGAIVTAIVAIGVGLPALRIRGLFLGVVTLAFASGVSVLLFDERYFGWLQPHDIRRPTLFLLDFEDERSMYYLCVAVLALMILLVVSLRRSRSGRVLIALRENENDLQAFGINVVRTKLAAFALSGFICGVAGVLFAHHQRAVGQTAFLPQASIDTFVYAIIGGVGSVTGTMLGAAFQSASAQFPQNDPILGFFLNLNVGLIAILYIAPSGFAGIAYAMRDSIYRIVAQRRQIVVPSLMADYDPTIADRQLIPLGEVLTDGGLSVLDADSRYQLTSRLYRATTSAAERGAPDDKAALGAAAERAGSEI